MRLELTAEQGVVLAKEAAQDLGIEVVKLPLSPGELNPIKDLWRALKRVVVVNLVCDSVDELAERATKCLDDLSADDVLYLAGLRSSEFDWLPT